MSKNARKKLAQLIYDAMREKVQNEKQEVKTSMKLSRGRPQGDAYKQGADLLGMSKTNFYNLVNSVYATSDVTTEKLFKESYKLRPQQTIDILTEEQTSADIKLYGHIRKLIESGVNTPSNSLQFVYENTQSNIQSISSNLTVLYRAIFQEWSQRYSHSKASRSSVIKTEHLESIKEIPFTLEDLQKPIRDLTVIMKQIGYLLKFQS